MAAINLSAIRSLLLPGLNSVFGDYKEIPAQWKELYEFNTSTMAMERDVETKLFGMANKRAEGAATEYDEARENATYVYKHFGVALGFIMTKYAMEDNLYKSMFKPNADALKRSMRQTKEVYAAAILNLATDTSPVNLGGDNQPLLSQFHPIDNGVVSNTPAIQAELNETSLNDGMLAVRKFRDVAGLKVMARGRKLVVTPDLEYVAKRLLGTTGRVGTSDNDINASQQVNDLTYTVNDFLTNPKGWFLKTDITGGLKHFERTAIETTMQPDFDTDNMKTKAHERYSFGWSNFRGIYGSQP